MYIEITKRYIDSDYHTYFTDVSKDGDIINLNWYGCEIEDPALVLDCYIDVPVPFKKGDLVEVDGYNPAMGNLYVIQNLSCDSPKHKSDVMQRDTSDMTAYVHYLADDSVECECMHFYPDLRYCRRELNGDERILKYVSLYMQDKICL